MAAALAWQWRAHRGPVMVVGLSTGADRRGAAAGGVVGAPLVHRRYGAIDVARAPVTPEHRVHYVVEAPPVFFGHTPLQIAGDPVAAGGDRGAGVRAVCATATPATIWAAIRLEPVPAAA